MASIGFACAAGLAAPSVRAGDIERLVMPGPVIQGHAEVETECSRCHRPFDRASEPSLCLKCHEEVAGDLDAGLGFHGRSPAVQGARCRSCHSEHQGRGFDAVGLNPDTFDHAETDYALEGAHALLACASCHEPGTRWRETLSRCIDCHRKRDAHDGRLGERCEECHVAASWGETHFDHDRTQFPLTGKHRDVACVLCHPGERYSKVATSCNGCHRLDDHHRGRFGTRCEDCHTPKAWKTIAFDHTRDTKFPLRGRHQRAACESCHRSGLRDEKLPTDCVSCHAADDDHRGRNGKRCDTCHRESSWREATFRHDRDTKFPLKGAHRDVRCQRCHPGNVYEDEVPKVCGPCHEADDVHRSQLGERCERCHNERSWSGEVFFDHDLTRFPLLGIHAVTSCDQCHSSQRFHDAELVCNTCHENDDVHEGGLGPRCERCHNPNAWPVWRFDHNVDTDFPLRGGHENLACRSCHRATTRGSMRVSSSCYACHAKDDSHAGAFGKDCGRCHDERSWREAEVVQ